MLSTCNSLATCCRLGPLGLAQVHAECVSHWLAADERTAPDVLSNAIINNLRRKAHSTSTQHTLCCLCRISSIAKQPTRAMNRLPAA
jgi:hypothetical protein